MYWRLSTQMSPYTRPNMACHSSSNNLSFVRVLSGFDTSSSCVSLTEKWDKRIRGKEHKRKQRGQLAVGVKGHSPHCDGTTVSRRCKVRHNNGIDQRKWPPLCWHAPYRVSVWAAVDADEWIWETASLYMEWLVSLLDH